VDLDLDLKADGLSSPVIELGHFQTYGSVVMPDVVDQKMDNGNQFNIDQVNKPGRQRLQLVVCQLRRRRRWLVV
jgi:hypothetical protein